MKKYLTAIIVLPLFLLAVGCTPRYEEPVDGYKPSSVDDDFPIPESAALMKTIPEPENPNIDNGAEYEVKGIGGEQGLATPKRYFQEIQAAGWTQLEEKQMGHVHFFQKDDTVIALEVREDSLTVYEMIKDAKF
ncbi:MULTISPECIES: hypothetical protein [Bacillales]|uniref:hypothetical protein n=1 Tax=Bacillales TaxID=1385 RepID=UPI0001788548|nr:hypothetical protein [Paenibacillus sp. Y412MC10]ACX66554.1 hypothetical protein GYMC10_4329 [Paenibacillus sp. Y412MC10]